MADKKKLLANNPLFADTTEESGTGTAAATPGATETAKRGRGENPELLRKEKGGSWAQDGLTADFTRASFIISVKALNAVKNYAYTKRLPMKDAISEIIENYIESYEANPDNEPLIKKHN